MSESILSLGARGPVSVATVLLDEIVHPGELDRLRHELHEHTEHTDFAAYVVDLSRLRYLTSAAIGMLVNVQAHLDASGRRLAVVADSEMVTQTLDHTHLEKVFPICTSVDAAVAKLSK